MSDRKQARYSIIGTYLLAMLLGMAVASATAVGSEPSIHDVTIEVDSSEIVGTSKTLLTVQVCPEPPMRRGGKIHDQWMAALQDLGMSYARLQPWAAFPRLSIAELNPSANSKTSWDFSQIDPLVLDFYQAQHGRPIVLNVALPRWLFKGPPHQPPEAPDAIDWDYEFDPNLGRQFRDPTFSAAARYFQRFARWYIRGGFVDEYGKEHRSGHHLKIDYWEVLNEQDEGTAHQLDPPTYTSLYDEVVAKLRKVDPEMKFSALALSDASNLHYFEYFLNRKNHLPGIPLDMVSYHEYVTAAAGKTLPEWQSEMFTATDRFLHTVKQIERIRQRLSPTTKTFISEFGIKSGDEIARIGAAIEGTKPYEYSPIPKEYWTLGASVFAYGYLGVLREGVDMVAAAELVDYPGNVAGTNLIDWETGEPNAVYRVVKLLHDALPPGTRLLHTSVHGKGVEAQGFDASGQRNLLLINKTLERVRLKISVPAGTKTRSVDITTGSSPPREGELNSDEATLEPLAVMMLVWPDRQLAAHE